MNSHKWPMVHDWLIVAGTDWVEVVVSVGGLTDIYPTSVTVSADSVWMIDCKGRVCVHRLQF